MAIPMHKTTNPAGANGGAREPDDRSRSELPGNSPTTSQKQYPVIGELSGSDTCSAAGITATGNAPILALCRQLLQAGLNPDQALEIYRGAILCLKVRSIAAGAQLTVEDDNRGTPRFRPWRGGAASLVRQNGAADTGYPGDMSPLLAGCGK
jgi:hypothetical protein